MLHPVVPRRADLLHRSCAARGNLKAERKGARKFLQRPTKNYRHVSTSQFFQLPKSGANVTTFALHTQIISSASFTET
jgi:hypothetical protein